MAGVESVTHVKDVFDATPAVSAALQPEADFSLHLLRVAARECCFIKNTSLQELQDMHELETDSVSHRNVNLMLADPPYSTCSALGQAPSAHDVFRKENIENALIFMSNVMAPEAHNHLFGFDLIPSLEQEPLLADADRRRRGG